MYKHIVAILGLCLWLVVISTNTASAQTPSQQPDTLRLTLKQVEDQFLRNNLQLIIQQYNINSAQAQVITARLFQNPDFNFSNVLYNPDTKKLFDVSRANGEYAVGISQLFLTAGKRNKNIRLAKIGVQQAQYQFFDLLRTLKLTLRTDFFNIYFQQQSIKVYNTEISSLANLMVAYRQQYAKGNIAQKELLRIQSELYSLRSELANINVGIDTTQSQLKFLIRANPGSYIVPQYDSSRDSARTVLTVPYQNLLDSAYTNRTDLNLAKATLDYNNVNLSLQKANAVPDINVNVNYDKQASYIKDYTGIGIDFPLPFFNRNQGNIKAAKIAIQQSKIDVQNQQNQIANDVAIGYKVALRYEDVYKSFDPQFRSDFKHLIQEVFKNYEKRNISLLEFLDFYDSYKTNVLEFNNIELNRATSLEQLNFATGTAFFNQ